MGRHTLNSAHGCVLTPRSQEINPKQTNKKGRIPFPGFVLQEMSNSALLQAGRREFREKKIPESIDPLKNACAGKRSPEDKACWKDRRMFVTQPCLLHDNYHAACVLTFLMTVIVPTAQVGKKKCRKHNKTTRVLIKCTCAAGLLLCSVHTDGWRTVMKSNAQCCAHS